MVPMNRTTSSRLMPTPLSATDSVRAAGSVSMRISGFSVKRDRSGLVSASKRSLSIASDALEISSRRKMSLLE